LVAKSAKEMGILPFHIHALGSPTPVMEQYKFDTLVDMIVNAKMNLPPNRPLHLFGAGHPFMFSLAVALGCDPFDSAAYALFARQDRYLTEAGTVTLDELEYFPCSCPACIKTDPKTVKEMPRQERQKLLAEHNLYVSFSELKRIKQAIIEGKLWEHMLVRAHGHPSLLQALKQVQKYSKHIEKQSPITKKSGLFFFNSVDLSRPEVIRYQKRLSERYSPPEAAKTLLLLPQTKTKPFHTSREYVTLLNTMQSFGVAVDSVHICTYTAPFGVVPTELDDVYPVSQNEIAFPLEIETLKHIAKQVAKYVQETNYMQVILLQDPKVWGRKIVSACRTACKKKNIQFKTLPETEPWAEATLEHLVELLKEPLVTA
jgi:7-cyano-7-deazaguanine tRNA-ribosyltransferase